MTVIMGVTFETGAMLFADTLRHHADTGASAGHVCKIHVFSPRVIIAKAGIGPKTDYLWQELHNRLPDPNVDAGTVAQQLRFLGKEAYERLAPEFAALPGKVDLQFIVAGMTHEGPSIHGIAMANNLVTDSYGIGKTIVFGVRGKSDDLALKHAEGMVRPQASGRFHLNLGKWATTFIADEIKAFPGKVRFPVSWAKVENGESQTGEFAFPGAGDLTRVIG